ncbi:ribosomal protein S4A [Orobanche hederae]
MARGLKKHLKRLNAPKHWNLDKRGGAFAPKPSSGPHKSRECMPLILILRNRLKYALTYREVIAILMQRHVLVDGKVRIYKTYPSGFMVVVSIPKTNENFRILHDTKGRFRLHSVRDEEAKFKLAKPARFSLVRRVFPTSTHMMEGQFATRTLLSKPTTLSNSTWRTARLPIS